MTLRCRWVVLALLLTAGAPGCADRTRWDTVPVVVASSSPPGAPGGDSSYGGGLAGGTVSEAQWLATMEAAKRATLEVFNTGCEFDATGSGVLIAKDILVTNRHVVQGARSLEVSAPGGTKIPVASWEVSTSDDLAILRLGASANLGGELTLATHAAVPGDLVAALGYPLGGPLKAGSGRVVDLGDGLGDSQMIRASMDVLPGNSGGPLIDTSGEVVGLIRAIDLVEGWALAIPVARVARAVEGADLRLGVPCRG